MQKLSSADRVKSINILRENISTRVIAKKPLMYVYDFMCCDSAFEDLRYVLDAAKSPLQMLDDERFKAVYGLDRRLEFRQRKPRPQASSDWWTDIY